MGRLTAEFSAAFSRDLKKKAKRRKWDLAELERLIDLVIENTPESMEVLKRCHNMHRLEGAADPFQREPPPSKHPYLDFSGPCAPPWSGGLFVSLAATHAVFTPVGWGVSTVVSEKSV